MTPARDPDVVVIGAGPAGATAACTLGGRGHRVLLVDRASFPRAKVCGCCLASSGQGILRSLGLGDLVDDGVPLDTTVVHGAGRSTTLPFPGSVTLSRERLDSALIDAARRRAAPQACCFQSSLWRSVAAGLRPPQRVSNQSS